MQLTRLVEPPELNNVLLVSAAVLVALLCIWTVLVTSSFLIQQLVRASGIETLAAFGEGLHKRARLLAVIASCGVILASIGLLGHALWQGSDLYPRFNLLLGEVTPETLQGLGRGTGLLLLLLLGFYALQRGGKRLMGSVERTLQERQLPPRQRHHAEKFLGHLPSIINLALANAVVHLAIATLDIPAPVAWVLTTVLYLLLAATGGRGLVFLLHFCSERLVSSWEGKSQGTPLEEYYAALRRLLPVGLKCIEAITHISVATLIVRRFQTLEPFAPYGPVLIRVVTMFFAASVVVEFSRVMISRLLSTSAPIPSVSDDVQRRRSTFIHLLQSVFKYVIYFCVSMMVLSDFGIDPTPILAGAGIVGLTVGLGAQTLVQDLLSGIFLLFEDQILNGDYIRIGETEGLVEEITPRVTRIRDRYGRLHIMRNGEIKNVINYSRGWTLAVVEMSVAYESNLSRVIQLMTELTSRLPELLPDKALERPAITGVEDLDESCLRIRVEVKVAPGCHFEVKRVLHQLLVEGFQAHNVEIPYPRTIEIASNTRSA